MTMAEDPLATPGVPPFAADLFWIKCDAHFLVVKRKKSLHSNSQRASATIPASLDACLACTCAQLKHVRETFNRPLQTLGGSSRNRTAPGLSAVDSREGSEPRKRFEMLPWIIFHCSVHKYSAQTDSPKLSSGSSQ